MRVPGRQAEAAHQGSHRTRMLLWSADGFSRLAEPRAIDTSLYLVRRHDSDRGKVGFSEHCH